MFDILIVLFSSLLNICLLSIFEFWSLWDGDCDHVSSGSKSMITILVLKTVDYFLIVNTLQKRILLLKKTSTLFTILINLILFLIIVIFLNDICFAKKAAKVANPSFVFSE